MKWSETLYRIASSAAQQEWRFRMSCDPARNAYEVWLETEFVFVEIWNAGNRLIEEKNRELR